MYHPVLIENHSGMSVGIVVGKVRSGLIQAKSAQSFGIHYTKYANLKICGRGMSSYQVRLMFQRAQENNLLKNVPDTTIRRYVVMFIDDRYRVYTRYIIADELTRLGPILRLGDESLITYN